jgi:predicted PurR-regulated permease PerM
METKPFGFYFLIFIILAITVKFYTIISSFFPPIATAFVLAFLANPIYLLFNKWTGKKSVSAIAVIFLISILIIVPMVLVLFAIKGQIVSFFSENTRIVIKEALNHFRDIFISMFGFDIFGHSTTEEIYMKFLAMFYSTINLLGPKLIASITPSFLSMFLIVFLMFYLLIGSKRVIDSFRYYFPLSRRNVDLLLSEIASCTRALVLGQFFIAAIQGTLGAIGFLIFGVPGVILWGFVMTILSFIPFLGSFLIWFPAGVIMIGHGNLFSGVGILLWGSALVGTIDNIIRPKLTSALGKIHPVTVLLGVFIGIKEWGFIGLVLGPITISVLLILICMFREEYLVETALRPPDAAPPPAVPE